MAITFVQISIEIIRKFWVLNQDMYFNLMILARSSAEARHFGLSIQAVSAAVKQLNASVESVILDC